MMLWMMKLQMAEEESGMIKMKMLPEKLPRMMVVMLCHGLERSQLHFPEKKRKVNL